MKAPLGLLIVTFLPEIGWNAPSLVTACVNTSYSQKHEVQITDDLVKIIMGQFAEHGPAFYEAELNRTESLLESDPGNFEAHIDHAAALLKLKRFEEAEEEFLRIEGRFPARYMTHANLGVLYKKVGRYPDSVAHTKRALEIQPEGHLGLGDYYLRMLQWRDEFSDPAKVPDRNFLGIPYADGPEAVRGDSVVKKDHLRTLVIADRHYADTYLVLGDLLFAEGDLELAFRCYHRAGNLLEEKHAGDPGSAQARFFADLVNQRQGWIRRVWRDRAKGNGRLDAEEARRDDDLRKEGHLVGQWLKRFQEIEAELIAAGENPDFTRTKTAMGERGISSPSYVQIGVVKWTSEAGPMSSGFLWLSAIGLVIGVLGWSIRRLLY